MFLNLHYFFGVKYWFPTKGSNISWRVLLITILTKLFNDVNI